MGEAGDIDEDGGDAGGEGDGESQLQNPHIWGSRLGEKLLVEASRIFENLRLGGGGEEEEEEEEAGDRRSPRKE